MTRDEQRAYMADVARRLMAGELVAVPEHVQMPVFHSNTEIIDGMLVRIIYPDGTVRIV